MKYTKLERNWVMYDVGNSALVLLNTSVVPIYFNAINTGASSQTWWSLGAMRRRSPRWSSPCSCPFWAHLADYAGNKIKFFLGFFLTAWCFAWRRLSQCPPWHF